MKIIYTKVKKAKVNELNTKVLEKKSYQCRQTDTYNLTKRSLKVTSSLHV